MTPAGPPTPAWRLTDADPSLVSRLAEEAGLSTVVARLLISRGVHGASDARDFLNPDLNRSWSDEWLPGMQGAAEQVAAAVRRGSRIVVFGDFDLDGISAAALTATGLREMGADVTALVPHRFREGYGLSAASIERVLRESPDLVITVDCGISSAEEVARLRADGVEVVVTDHHEPGDSVPEGVPVVDAKLAGSDAPGSALSGAGVALKLIAAVGRVLGHEHVWRELTDLATLGTIADVVPLRGENRAIVADGIRRTRETPRLGIAALAEQADVELARLESEQIAFWLAPRLNAAGRMADPAIALELLLAEDAGRAAELARFLEEHNRLRQAAEQDLFEVASKLAGSELRDGDRALVLAGEGWHEGVKGIVAARLAAAYRVPTLLFCTDGGVATGSGRTAGAIDLFAAVSSCGALLDRFGGHSAAVGASLPTDRLPEFRDRLNEALAALPDDAFVTAAAIDAELPLDALSIDLAEELEALQPFGHGNPRPRLASRAVFMNGRRRVGRDGSHLRFTAFDGVTSVPAIAFRAAEIEDLAGCTQAVDIAYHITADEWQGRRRASIQVSDIRQRPAPADAPAAMLVEELFRGADEMLARARQAYAGIGDAEAFHTKLAGVTFEGRQEHVARLKSGMPLRLQRQADNPHDANACALIDVAGEHVGFFNRGLAAELAPLIDAGVEYDVEVTDITGGEHDPEPDAEPSGRRSLGVNVRVSRRDVEACAPVASEAADTRALLATLSAAELDARLLRHFIGERAPRPAQLEALNHLAAGRGCLVVMATGRGKSLVFHLHAARRAIAANEASVFVFPLRALVADQAFHLEEALARIGVSCRTITGESVSAERDALFADLDARRADVILTTPEFLERHAARFAEAGRVRFVVIDEAHYVGGARAGHRPAYARLAGTLCALAGGAGSPPVVCAATATASDATVAAIREVTGVDALVADPSARENLALIDRRGAAARAQDKDAYLASVASDGGKLIVYVNSREQSVRVARSIRARMPELACRVAFYNGALTRSARHAVEGAFREGGIQVVVATSAFGEGVNVPDVRHVVLYHLPMGDVAFNQTCGRAGRDGETASVHLLFGSADARLNEMILGSAAPKRDELAGLYLTLKEMQRSAGAEPFEVSNAELADRVGVRDPKSRLTDKGVSAGLGVFRELGLLTAEGAGSYRRLRVRERPDKVDLGLSVRYSEALREVEDFARFKEWVLSAAPEELLRRFNRPILPSGDA